MLYVQPTNCYIAGPLAAGNYQVSLGTLPEYYRTIPPARLISRKLWLSMHLDREDLIMVRSYCLFFFIVFFAHVLDAAHIVFPAGTLQRYCATGDWKSAEKLFMKKITKNPKYKWPTSLIMLCTMRAFEDNNEFLSTLISYNNEHLITLPDNVVSQCVRKKHYTEFRIALKKSDEHLSKSLNANLLVQLIKDQAPDDIFDAIFERYQIYLKTHQRLPVSLEARDRGSLETVLGYAFSHGHLRHARMLLQNGADFVEGILKKDDFGYYLMDKTEWDSAIVGLWCEQDDWLKRLKHHVFKREKIVASLLVQFFMRAIDSPFFSEIEDLATLFRYQELISCVASVGHTHDQCEFDCEQWLNADDGEDELTLRNWHFDVIKKEVSNLASFLSTMRRFQQCKVHGCPGGAFSLHKYFHGTDHFECELCFHLQCVLCGERHPQASCKTKKTRLR